MTSIIVHGVTIPIGKSLHATTLTITRSTGATDANLVSRLPPAVPIGMPNPAVNKSVTQIDTSVESAPQERDIASAVDDRVRFELPPPTPGRGGDTTFGSKPPSRPSSRPSSRPPSRPSSVAGSRPGTPVNHQGDHAVNGAAGGTMPV